MRSKVLAFMALAVSIATPGWASVISVTPSLPPVGAVYLSAGGAGCFPAAGVCVEPGTISVDALVSSTFNASGQDIVADVTLLAMLTTLANTPLGSVTLTGTMEEEVLGRTFPTQTGTWNTELLALSLTGPVLGHTLLVGLDGANASIGQTSVLPDGAQFRIDSFFDVFVELSLDGPTPLHTTRGPIHFALAPSPSSVPEPASIALVGLAFGALRLNWRARRAATARPRPPLVGRHDSVGRC